MSRHFDEHTPLGKRVIVFDNSLSPEMAHASLGLFGTIVAVYPDPLPYEVRLDHNERIVRVDSSLLLPICEDPKSCDICFTPSCDREETLLAGKLSFPGRPWDEFAFEKGDVIALTYELRIPARGNGSRHIQFIVPRAFALDHAFARNVLATILGVTKWREVSPGKH